MIDTPEILRRYAPQDDIFNLMPLALRQQAVFRHYSISAERKTRVTQEEGFIRHGTKPVVGFLTCTGVIASTGLLPRITGDAAYNTVINTKGSTNSRFQFFTVLLRIVDDNNSLQAKGFFVKI